VNGEAGGQGRVAAFFDLDGTLVARPSLERRFLGVLKYRHAIPPKNYFLWLAHAIRLAPRGIAAIAHANKMYLCGLRVDSAPGSADTLVVGASGSHATRGNLLGGTPLRPPPPLFLPQALERAAWHARRRHVIVLVTGTLAPLAHEVALSLALRLAARRTPASIGVCATRLEEANGRWTGQIIGDAMFGEAKGRAIRRVAAQQGFDLSRCYAYGDSAGDRWMLGAVGRPAAVNPSPDLDRIAHLQDWPVLSWKEQAAETCRKAEYLPVASAKTESLR
jgi:HAD superfamily phosphoserine phosphatase-like hydrolase